MEVEPRFEAVDDLRIHAHIFSWKIKVTVPPDFKQLLIEGKKNGDVRLMTLFKEYTELLSQKREQLLAILNRKDSELALSDGSLPEFMDYVALLNGLISEDTSLNKPVDASLVAQQPQPVASRWRKSVLFAWHDAVFNQQNVACDDAIFELVSAIIAMAGARSRYAAFLSRDTRAGMATAQASQVFRLLSQSARELEYASKHLCPSLQHGSGSADCSPEAVKALLEVTCADIQSISVLRAMAKANSPGLIASLSVWAADTYRMSANSASAAPYSLQRTKLQQYAEFKAACFRSYMLAFAGLDSLKADRAGQAVKLISEAQKEAKASLPLAAAFNKAAPSTPAAEHAEFDTDLKVCVDSAYKRVLKENENVYYQSVPTQMPDLPLPRKVVPDTGTFQLPAAHPLASELHTLSASAGPSMSQSTDRAESAAVTNPSSKNTPGNTQAKPPNALPGQPSEKEPASCFRWLLVIIAMPLLAIISVVGLIVWLVLLPIKIICCPIGCLVQIIADVVENLLKAPFKALLWASGKPYKAKQKVQDVGP